MEFREANSSIEELLSELRKSNELAGEVRDKLVGEITAGMAILHSPKPDLKMLEILLLRPLKYIADKAAGPLIGGLAVTAAAALAKLMGIL